MRRVAHGPRRTALTRRRAGSTRRRRHLPLPDEQGDDKDGYQPRDDAQPEDRTICARCRRKHKEGDAGPHHGPELIHRAMEPEIAAQVGRRGGIGDDGVSRSCADALAEAVDEPHGKHQSPGPRKG